MIDIEKESDVKYAQEQYAYFSRNGRKLPRQ